MTVQYPILVDIVVPNSTFLHLSSMFHLPQRSARSTLPGNKGCQAPIPSQLAYAPRRAATSIQRWQREARSPNLHATIVQPVVASSADPLVPHARR
eukprot:CAMPEP_0194494748 /NCGR_PEP_ID=MMETSP0253-20130528/12563_1 /TAXON_ID=2966 /ORGANISM="Noctiluca scintillans" /LENGTH=95 /DNA_ID=CAMNT_0039335911 /DNA_START=535 /DNA_END=822 /DNA_ORIENTATION=-